MNQTSEMWQLYVIFTQWLHPKIKLGGYRNSQNIWNTENSSTLLITCHHMTEHLM